jgi:histidine phosphotransferase ChpT
MIKPKLHELVASRICHDLISPIGACANGAELLAMGGGNDEAELIGQSAAHASGRVRFFRIAFGQSSAGSAIGSAEIGAILKAISTDRLTYDWTVTDEIQRAEAQAIMLSLLCLERALPRGGAITVKHRDDAWSFVADAAQLLITDALWLPLSEGRAPDEVLAATVSFALLPVALEDLRRQISIRMTDTRILMQF